MLPRAVSFVLLATGAAGALVQFNALPVSRRPPRAPMPRLVLGGRATLQSESTKEPTGEQKSTATEVPRPTDLVWSAPERNGRRRVWADDDEDEEPLLLSDIDLQVTRVVSQVSADGLAVTQFSPEAQWLWKRWKDTVLERTWHFVVGNMALSALFVTFVNFWTGIPCSWPLFTTPLATHPLVARLL
jgi:hypothetical protein